MWGHGGVQRNVECWIHGYRVTPVHIYSPVFWTCQSPAALAYHCHYDQNPSHQQFFSSISAQGILELAVPETGTQRSPSLSAFPTTSPRSLTVWAHCFRGGPGPTTHCSEHCLFWSHAGFNWLQKISQGLAISTQILGGRIHTQTWARI